MPMNKLLVKVVFAFLIINLSACSAYHRYMGENETAPAYATPPPSQGQQPTQQEGQEVNAESHKTDQNKLQPVDVSSVNIKNPLIDASIEKTMDANDKVKMSKALDKAPGKTTEWTNDLIGITYSVTPIKKVVLNNNPFCREYEIVIAKKGNMNTVRGTACIAEDGNWHTI